MRFKIRRGSAGWVTTWPAFGFNQPTVMAFDSYADALEATAAEIHRRSSPQSLYATTSSPGTFSPWTLRSKRL